LIEVHLLSIEFRGVIVDVGDDDAEESRRLLRRAAQVRHVKDQGVVGPVLAIELHLKLKVT
jgi:hypothetical protein